MGLLKSRPAVSENVVGDVWAPPGGVFVKCPVLVEYLSAGAYEDGTVRQTSTITIFVEGRGVKLALNDREVRRGLYVQGDTLEDALRALERHVSSERPDWRRWPDDAQRKRK
jgi:hypothetical protein